MEIEVNKLKPGMILERDVVGKSGKPIVPKNTKLTDVHIKFIRKFLIEKVSVSPLHDGRKDQEMVEEILETSKRNTVFTNTFLQSVKLYKQMFLNVRNNVTLQMYEIREKWIPIFEEVSNKPFSSILKLIKQYSEEESFYEKKVLMTFLSIAIAVKLNYAKKDWLQIGFAALFSDLGIAKLEDGVNFYQDENWRLHPIYSYKLIENEMTINKHAKLAILQHHECLDGTGFPSNMKEGKIHPYAQILAVSDYVLKESKRSGLEHLITLLNTYKGSKYSEKVVDVVINEIKQDL